MEEGREKKELLLSKKELHDPFPRQFNKRMTLEGGNLSPIKVLKLNLPKNSVDNVLHLTVFIHS